MKKYIILLVVFCSTILSYSQEKYSEHYYKRYELFKSEVDTKNEIVFLGNSITEGGDWKTLFPTVNAVNRGISGDVTDGILNRLDEVLSSQPKKIFLLIGTNDLARGKSVQQVIQNYKKSIEYIQTNSSTTILYIQSILPVNPLVGTKFPGHKIKQNEIIETNKNLKIVANNYNVLYIDLYKSFKNSKGYLKPKYTHDGLHLNNKGYNHWKKIIKNYVR